MYLVTEKTNTTEQLDGNETENECESDGSKVEMEVRTRPVPPCGHIVQHEGCVGECIQ